MVNYSFWRATAIGMRQSWRFIILIHGTVRNFRQGDALRLRAATVADHVPFRRHAF
jgi:hypothetical protein